MKVLFSTDRVSRDSVLIACSSHEERCAGTLRHIADWHPRCVVLFHYTDDNAQRERRHAELLASIKASDIPSHDLPYTKSHPTASLRRAIPVLADTFTQYPNASIVLDISVMTRQHFLMLCQWLQDAEHWDRVVIVYSEPAQYDVSEYMPLSFGLQSLEQIPGLAPCADLSRPIHLVLFLGYEGDRAMAVYDHVQPSRTTLIVPDPPYQQSWAGLTERFNADLISLVGANSVRHVESIDPDIIVRQLEDIAGGLDVRSKWATILVPLGTKPQALGAFLYSRLWSDQAAIIYARPRRYNNRFYSHGVGNTWIIKDKAQ